jgi:DNA-3-methyladenine glycosylase II
MQRISSIADLEKGIAYLAAREPRLAMIAREGLPPLRLKAPGFASLTEILIEQMISLKAAGAITARVQSQFGPFTAQGLARAEVMQLMALGLSRAKAEALKAVAQAIAEERFDLATLEAMEDDEACLALMKLKGIGPWTANIYLLTALGRSDAWPLGDVALQAAVQSLFELNDRPHRKQMNAIAEEWRPWRSVAARLLWLHYRKLKAQGSVKTNPLAPFTASLHKI